MASRGGPTYLAAPKHGPSTGRAAYEPEILLKQVLYGAFRGTDPRQASPDTWRCLVERAATPRRASPDTWRCLVERAATQRGVSRRSPREAQALRREVGCIALVPDPRPRFTAIASFGGKLPLKFRVGSGSRYPMRAPTGLSPLATVTAPLSLWSRWHAVCPSVRTSLRALGCRRRRGRKRNIVGSLVIDSRFIGHEQSGRTRTRHSTGTNDSNCY